MKSKILIILLNVVRIIFGITFIFSGFVKAIDPMGSAYKFLDYFRAFDMTWLNNFAIPMAVVLATLEFLVGVCVLIGLFRSIATKLGLLFMTFFTPLTLYLAIANPVKDCGCFGDAITLTNWETFYKNIFLLAFAIILYMYNDKLKPLFSERYRFLPLSYFICLSVGISLIGLINLPIIDFRPFKVGVNIREEMKVDNSNERYVLVYEKDGVKQEFDIENYPSDSTWTFVETKTIVDEEAMQPTILDFFVTDAFDNDLTEELLNDATPTFLLISPDWSISDDSYVHKFNDLYEYTQEKGYNFYAVSSQNEAKEMEWADGTGAQYPFLYSDATILETIIRSRPGLVMLIDGTIIWKQHPRSIPSTEVIEQQIEDYNNGIVEKNDDSKVILMCILLLFVPIILFLSSDKLLSVGKAKTEKE